MSSDVELLPLPAIERWNVTGDYAFPTATDPEGHAVDYDAHVDAMQSYARANVEHHAAPLQAENERLRAELDNKRADGDRQALDGFDGVVDCCDAKGCWLVLTDEATDITRGQRVRIVPEPPAEANGVEGAELRAIHSCHDQCQRPACVRRQRDELRAEVERLTFEMSCLQQQYDERTAYVIVHRGAALACSDAMRAAYSDEHYRADRLAEALRGIRRDALDGCSAMDCARDAFDVLRELGLLREQEDRA